MSCSQSTYPVYCLSSVIRCGPNHEGYAYLVYGICSITQREGWCLQCDTSENQDCPLRISLEYLVEEARKRQLLN